MPAPVIVTAKPGPRGLHAGVDGAFVGQQAVARGPEEVELHLVAQLLERQRRLVVRHAADTIVDIDVLGVQLGLHDRRLGDVRCCSPQFGSGVDDVDDAVFVSVSGDGGFITKDSTTLLPDAIVPNEHVFTAPDPVQLAGTDVTITCAGRVSVTTTLFAGPGPAFDTVTVYVSDVCGPAGTSAFTGSFESVLVIDTSALRTTVSTTDVPG